MDKITVAVCGDSFCSASINDLRVTGSGRRAHFSQMLEDVYGYRVLYRAHGGFSNAGIFWQIQEAIAQQAQVVVYNKTWSNRLELIRYAKFDINCGLKNFFYYDPNYQSSGEPFAGTDNAPAISTTHWNIENSPFFTISKEQKLAIDLYFKHLYSDNMKSEMDRWMFEYWHDRMIKSGCLPVFFNQDGIGKIAYEFSAANPSYDTPFHTDRATQEQIASNIHRYIVDNLSQ